MRTLFLLVMLGIGCCVSGVITFRWTATTELNLFKKSAIFILLLGVLLSPFLLKCPPHCLNGKVCNALLYITYFGFVCLFLFFCLLFGRDFCWLIGHKMGLLPSISEPLAVLKANIGLLMCVVGLSGYALWAGVCVPVVKEIQLVSEKINAPLTMVVLSDLHLSRMVALHKVQEIVKQANAQKPDVILLPGDIVDDEPEFISDLVLALKGLNAPAYVVDGNHELYRDREEAHREFQKAGLTYLENEGLWIRTDVWLGGVPDIQAERFGYQIDVKRAMPDKQGYSILLAHAPKMFDMPENKADLQVSGHTHGGQIFPMHFLTKLANTYLAGIYHQGQRAIYVSRGSGQWGPQMRLFAPSEITVIRVYPAKADFK